MAEANGQESEGRLDAIVLQFIEARTRGEAPDIDEFVKQYAGLEEDIRRRIASFGRVDSLFDLVKRVDDSDFATEDTGCSLIGKQIAGFKIIEIIGQGGMGIVYRAQDTRLDRFVAVKTMPAHLLEDEAAQARFSREAKLLAALNHPHIAAIHDIVQIEDGVSHLILEYVPGQTLGEHVANKPVKVHEALVIAQQLAEALAAAYERGVIHRDLKPGNIKITPDGNVKILDFGIAKAFGPAHETQETAVTRAGRLVGTPAYMSPEQTRDKNVDHRSDIWSFGCVFYEMLTGHLAFEGETISDTIASVLQREPDWRQLPQDLPQNIRVLLRRCLEKDPRLRIQHIGDAAVEIRETLAAPAVAPPTTATSGGMRKPAVWRRSLVIGTLFGVVLTGITLWIVGRPALPPARPIRALVINPETRLADEALLQLAHALAFSPDGERLAYIEQGADRRRRIYVREMNEFRAEALAGTEGAESLFFSPDGGSIGYMDSFQRKLKKVSISGSEPIVICSCRHFGGASWAPNGEIVFSQGREGLWRVSASGEGLRQLTIPDVNAGEVAHNWPQVLPGGEAVLFTCARLDTLDQYRCEVYSLKTGERHVLLQGGSDARYVRTGHIVHAREEVLFAARVDLDRYSLIGTSVAVLHNVAISDHWSSQFTVADDGSLAYVPVPESGTRRLEPVLISKEGQVQRLPSMPQDYHSVSISPDGSKAALDIWKGHNSDIWIYDLDRKTLNPLTNDHRSAYPVWQPDGRNIVFQSSQANITKLPSDGSANPENLLEDLDVDLSFRPTCCSPDGKRLLVTSRDPNRPGLADDIWAVSFDKAEGAVSVPVVQREYNQRHGMWSPDGRWIAYSSEETGRWEVYVEPYPGPGPRIPISTEGGYNPSWSNDGDELYYRIDNKVVGVTIETEPDFKVVASRDLFEGEYESCLFCKMYDVAPDGRFLMIRNPEKSSPPGINVVLNWLEELNRVVPAHGER
ncbi:MAG: protein kinase domain-containing protein [Planctomycetota bacterium]|jgi:serine/threonine-protein kinase